MMPHSGVGGCAPKPRKLNAAPAIIAPATLLVAITIVGFPVAIVLRVLFGQEWALRFAAWFWAPLMFTGAGARLVPIPVDENGLVVEALARAAATHHIRAVSRRDASR